MSESPFGPQAPHPERLGRYELLVPIASGGMATVFLARSLGLAGFEREVALKLTHEHLRDSPEFFSSLIDEARLAGRIRHPNVVSVLDVDEVPGSVFIVMDYVEGDSLAGLQRILRRRSASLPVGVALRVLDDMLTGLHAAHELRDPGGAPMHLVHRDVTPHNVLVGVDGVSRLADFGIARAASRVTKTQTGLVKGKLAYMSPEQARGGRVDRTCDVWAAGVVAWETLTGLRLYEGLNDAALLLKIVREPPTPLRHVRPDLPREIADVVGCALTLSSAARYPTAEAFAEALAAAARAAGVEVADARGVRAAVQPLVAPQLEARRRRVLETLARRGHVQSSPAWPAPESEPSTGIESARSAATVVVEPPAPAFAASADLPDTASVPGMAAELPPTASERLERASDRTAATGYEAPVGRLSHPNLGPSTLLTAPLRSRVWIAVAAIPVVVLVLVWTVLAAGPRAREPAAAAPVASALPAAAPAPPAVDAAAAGPPAPSSAEATAEDEPGVITPSELAVESAPAPKRAGAAAVARPRRAPRPAAPASPAPEPPQPAPLDNPYKHR